MTARRMGLVAGLLLAAAPAWGQSAQRERVVLSAPILPQVLVLYQQAGDNFPTSLAEEQQLAKDVSLTFEKLLTDCQQWYPGIKQWTAGSPPLTSEELTANYDLVAQCSYEHFTSKPYWIPKIVNDVDICGLVLGAGWRMPTEADVLSFAAADLQLIESTLTSVGGNGWGAFYFSLLLYVRGADGSLLRADLRADAASRFAPMDATLTTHVETGEVLRCLRRDPIVASP